MNALFIFVVGAVLYSVVGAWVTRLQTRGPPSAARKTALLLPLLAGLTGALLTVGGYATFSTWLLAPTGLVLGSLAYAAYRVLNYPGDRELRSILLRALAMVNVLPLICSLGPAAVLGLTRNVVNVREQHGL